MVRWPTERESIEDRARLRAGISADQAVRDCLALLEMACRLGGATDAALELRLREDDEALERLRAWIGAHRVAD